MGSSNTFSKALKHLKASRPSSLHEEVPTNNTQNLYRVEPDTTVETHPGVDAPDFDQDGDGSSGYTGTDTSGLFMPDGTIRVAEPPGDTSAILGPMASMWYAWGNFSTFGYIRQSDRKMVNLGRITGKLSDWDGVSGFTSYNADFTIDQAVWFKDVEKYGGISNDPAEANYRAFYPGPPSNTPDQYGRYYCTTTGRPKNQRTGSNPPNRGPEGAGFPWGSGSNPNNRRRRGQGGPGGTGGPGEGGPGEGGGFGGPGGPGGPGGEGGEGGDGPPKPPDETIDPNTGEPREPATPEELQKAAEYAQYLAQKSVDDPGSLTPAEQARLDSYSSDDSIFKSAVDDAIARAQATQAPGLTKSGQEKLRSGQNLGIDEFDSAADFAAFDAGGGNAAMRQKGLTAAQVIAQGNENINKYDGGPRTPDYRDYKGPAFGNDTVANRERQKAKDQRVDDLFNYWNDNYVDPDPAKNPNGLTNKQRENEPEWYRQISQAQDPNNYAGAFKDTDAGKAVNNFMNDPTHGWWRQAVLDVGVGAIAQKIGGAKTYRPGSLGRGSNFTVGATGLPKPGYEALKGGQNLHRGSKGLLSPGGKGVYAAPNVGERGQSAIRPGSGASRYVKYGSNPLGGPQGKGGEAGGVVGSVVPPRATRMGGLEPQSVVDPKTFQKGQRIFQKAFDPKYAKTPTAQKIRQQATQAGFGDSPNIPANQLPRMGSGSPKSSSTTRGTTFNKFMNPKAASAAAAGAAVGNEVLNPQSAEGAREISANDGQDKLQKQLGKEYSLEPIKGGKGDHIRYRIMKNGVPVQGPGSVVGGGVRGGGTKGQRGISSSFEQGIDNFINAQRGGGTGPDASGQAKGTRKVQTSSTKGKPTKTGSKGPVRQPAPTSRSTIKTMPASKMGKAKPTTVKQPTQPPIKPSSPSWRGGNVNLGNLKGRFRNIRFGDEVTGDVLSEKHREIIRDIKKPVVIPEAKQEKIKRRPRVIGSEPRTINTGLMKQAEVPASFKKPEERMWGKYEREQNARASQDRKNVVLDHLGNANDAWEYLLDRNAGKRSFAGYFEKDGTPRTIFTDGKVKTVTREEKVGSDTIIFFTDEEGKKGRILQSEYNELQDQAHTQQMFAEYEATLAAEQETAFDKIVDKLELKAEKNPTNDKIQSMLSSYRALSHLRKEDKKQEAHFTSWKSSIDGTITSNFQSWVDTVGQETADAVAKVALAEKMSSANLFGATLPATGDYDHIDMTFDSTYLDPDNDDIVNGAGNGSGYQGGFPVADGENDVIQLSAFGRYSASAYTTDQDLTYVDTLSVTAIAGNGSNGGITPINGLDVYFLGDDDWAGPFTVAPSSQSSYANSQITIPENLRTKNVAIYLYSDTSEYINGMNLSVRHFGDMFFNVPGLDYIRIRDIFPNEAGNADAHGEDFLSYYLGRANYSRSNPDHMYSIGHYYWYNVNAQRFGLTISGSSMEDYVWAQWPPAPVSGNTVGNADGTLNGVPTRADYERVGEMIWDQFVGTKLWGISNISFKRKAPASVYVPLDSPEAINFMRTAPEMKGLTPAQRLKKLKDMLAAGNEYLIKMLGVSGSTATPGPDEVAQGLPYTDEDDAFDNPYYDEPFKDPGDLDDSDDESTWDYAKGDSGTEVASARGPYGTPGADKPYVRRGYKDKDGKFVDYDNPATWPSIVPKLPRASKKQKTVVAHHEPKGKYLADSKTFKKKSFSNWYSSMESEISDKVVEDTKKLIEGMTTGSLFNAPLPPAGDTDIVDKQTVFATHDGQNEALVNGEIVLTDDGDNDIADGEHTAFRQSWLHADASESSHIQITISKGGGTSNWTDRGTQQWDDHVGFFIGDADNFDAPYYYTDNLPSGTHMIPLPGNYKRAFIYVSQFAKLSTSESPGATGTLRIKHVSLKRKTPVSVFVPLDSPEAVNFMRTNPLMQGLTPAERLMRLKRMLAAGNKYLFQQLGYKGSSATPGDMAQGLPYTDLDDAFDDPYYKGPPPDLDDDSDFDPDDFEYASADWPKGRPGPPPIQAPWNKGWPTAPGGRPYQGPPGTPGGKYPMAKGRKGPRTA